MAMRMLIDATHMEETRVVVLNGNRLEEFDFETSTKKQLKGNFYLAKVARVEPSLQAAFVDFGGNRHGFLAFNEIHPDYYQIPVADRRALLKEEEELAAEALEARAGLDDDDLDESETELDDSGDHDAEPVDDGADEEGSGDDAAQEAGDGEAGDPDKAAESLEEVGGEDEAEFQAAGRRRTRSKRQRYKIQEVIKRRQIILVQVVKEERGTKGAALTTYLSLPGRYCVLMPNTTKGGGISRKITSPKDRNRLKGFISDLDIPDGVAIILRTAAIERSKAEIRRDFEYLIRTWHLIRDTTLKSIAPTLVYEEGNLIKRSIRDLYSKDMDEVLVEGEEGYKTAKDFMRMLMPSHAKRVQPYKDANIPLYHRYQVDSQIDAMHSADVQLKSGGYVVISPTEALVAIDVNSGRATRARSIEETAYKTNLEAAEEIARQLKLRDLAGLIVIDFIDMVERRNQNTVQRRLKEAMRSDRARIQIGRISPFGLLELSRQRLRPSLLETSTKTCPHCEGSGLIRSTESAALHVLRAVEEEGIRRRSGEIQIAVATSVALYILNEKRDMLTEIQNRHGFRVLVTGDDSLVPPNYRLDRVADKAPEDRPAAAVVEGAKAEDAKAEETKEEKPGRRRRARRRTRRGEQAPGEAADAVAAEQVEDEAAEADAAAIDDAEQDAPQQAADGAEREAGGEKTTEKPRRRRRGRRGGRHHARRIPAETAEAVEAAEIGINQADAKATAAGDAVPEDAKDAHQPEGLGGDSAIQARVGDGDEIEAPKRRRRSRTRKSPAGPGRERQKPAGEAPLGTGAEPAPVVEQAVAPEAGDEAPKPRRRRRRAAKPTTPDAEPVVQQAAAPDGDSGNGAEAGSGNGAGEPANPPSIGAALPERASPERAPNEPEAGKRRGWWNRLTQ
ncbi:MAG: Rne/Rng family ribonuclease [Alphaproteobacteria bacterium]